MYDVQQQSVSSQWPIIQNSALPISTFHCRAGTLKKIERSCPPNAAILHRILVRRSNKQVVKQSHFGLWSADRNLLVQHKWSDGVLLLDTSTSQLRALQAQNRFKPHGALSKWETELGCNIPIDIWSGMWLNFRGASENTFLWQLVYRVIATQKWRFPALPAVDPQVHCTRCDLGVREDVVHCVWGCSLSQPCWQWGLGLLTACSGRRSRQGGLRGNLEPAHIFVAAHCR